MPPTTSAAIKPPTTATGGTTADVSRPSDALTGRAAAQDAFTSLFVGLGAVALLVGGVGIANVMVIAVLERRSEIGHRRALGATRRLSAVQFVAESLLLSLLGVGGVALGAIATVAYAVYQGLLTSSGCAGSAAPRRMSLVSRTRSGSDRT